MADCLPTWSYWKRRYNSPPDDLINEFYIPALARSCRYDRAVGFFSSRLLAMVAPAIDQFVINGGTMRLITSPENLSDDDLEAMGKGEEFKHRLRHDLQNAVSRPIPSQVLTDRLKLLTWMIAKGKLEIRIAMREHADFYSLFHEKIGVFADADGNWMTFTGSPNETVSAACRHSESFPLHCSWINKEQHAYAQDERERFAAIWSESVEGIATWTINEWIEEPMREHFGEREPSGDMLRSSPAHRVAIPPLKEANPPVMISTDEISLLPSLPGELNLYDFQRSAVNDWLTENGRGTFAMATGTGKTITALAAATQASLHVARTNRPLLVLITVPLIDLVEQWSETAVWFGFRPARCHGNLTSADRDRLKATFSAARSTSGRRAEMVITTAASLTPQAGTDESQHFLQRQLERHDGPLLVIGDEMHSLGTSRQLAALPANPTFTLGLSATPKRHGDEEGTEALLEYFGAPVITISIKEAIYTHKALVEYDYLPSRVELTLDEAEEYRRISVRIATAFADGDDQAADSAIRARTRLTQHAQNKLVRLRQLMSAGLKDATHQIIYVAEGRSPDTDLQQLVEAERILREEFGMRVDRYYGKTEGARREVLQRQLAAGEIQALLAMKCLDEGVDIPSARIGVITASTQNPRQFVQRRGRLLRRDPNNPKSHAVIHDFIVMPPLPQTEPSDSEKSLIGAELSRAAELADAARNREVLFELIEWAWQHRLSPERYPWMSLTEQQEMEDWIP